MVGLLVFLSKIRAAGSRGSGMITARSGTAVSRCASAVARAAAVAALTLISALTP